MIRWAFLVSARNKSGVIHVFIPIIAPIPNSCQFHRYDSGMWANKVRLRHESGSFKKKSRLAQSEKTWQLPEQRTLNRISLILAMERMIVLPGGACGEADKRER